MKIRAALGPLFSDLGRPLELDDSSENLSEWDSLRHLDVILAIEEALGITLSTAEIAAMRSVRGIISVLHGRGIAATL